MCLARRQAHMGSISEKLRSTIAPGAQRFDCFFLVKKLTTRNIEMLLLVPLFDVLIAQTPIIVDHARQMLFCFYLALKISSHTFN